MLNTHYLLSFMGCKVLVSDMIFDLQRYYESLIMCVFFLQKFRNSSRLSVISGKSQIVLLMRLKRQKWKWVHIKINIMWDL